MRSQGKNPGETIMLLQLRQEAMTEHRVWRFYGGWRTISSGPHLSASPGWQQQRKLMFWSSCGEQWAISSSLSAVCCLGHLPAWVWGLLCLHEVRDIFASHWNSTVALCVRSWAVACYPALALENRGCFWDWEGKLGSVVFWCHCHLVTVGMWLL